MAEVKKIAWDEEVLFTNWSDTSIECEYDFGGRDAEGKRDRKDIRLYVLEAGKSYFLPHYLAIQFAKELSQREYNKEFISNLEKAKKKSAAGTDRKVIENVALHMIKGNKQEMIDKCVQRLPEEVERIDVPQRRQVKLHEAVLNRDRRNLEVEESTGVKSQVNRKALKESEQFN